MYSYGVTKAEVGIFSSVDGSVSGWKEIELYKDTFTMGEDDPTQNDHYQQGVASPKIVRETTAPTKVNFSIMDLSADSKIEWVGGTKTTVATVDTWHSPRLKRSQIKALRFTLEEGGVITIAKVQTYGKPDVKASDADINLILVTGTILDPGFEDVLPVDWKDAG